MEAWGWPNDGWMVEEVEKANLERRCRRNGLIGLGMGALMTTMGMMGLIGENNRILEKETSNSSYQSVMGDEDNGWKYWLGLDAFGVLTMIGSGFYLSRNR